MSFQRTFCLTSDCTTSVILIKYRASRRWAYCYLAIRPVCHEWQVLNAFYESPLVPDLRNRCAGKQSYYLMCGIPQESRRFYGQHTISLFLEFTQTTENR